MQNQCKLFAALLLGAVVSGTPQVSAAQTAQAAATQATTTVPLVADARNTTVGPAYYSGVVFRVQGQAVYVPLSDTIDLSSYSTTDRYWQVNGAYWPTNNCSGTPLIPAIQSTPFAISVITRSGNTVTLYIAAATAATLQQFNSYGLNPNSCGVESGTIAAFNVGSTINLNQLYPEPLHVK